MDWNNADINHALKVLCWSGFSALLVIAGVYLADPQVLATLPAWIVPLVPLVNSVLVFLKQIVSSNTQ